MPKFLMLARSDARAWEGLSAEEGQRIVKQYVDWSDRMRAAGRLAGSNKLKDGEGRVLSGNGGQMSVKDGPYSETKEVVGGYWLLEAADFDEAVNVTLGLPIVRTSPSHGTAFDIAWQGKARAEGMLEAIRVAALLATQKRSSA